MGIFTPQPEDPEEWAGLPSEPLRPEDPAAALPSVSVTPGLLDGGLTSLSIPMPTVGDAAHGTDAH